MYVSYKNIYSWNPLLSIMLLDSVDQERKQGPRCFLSFSFAILSKAACLLAVCLLRFASFKVWKWLPVPYRWPECVAIFQGSKFFSWPISFKRTKKSEIIPRRSLVDFALPLTGENIVSCPFPNQSLPRVLE